MLARMVTRPSFLGLLPLALLAAACGGSTADNDAVPLPQGRDVFAFGLDPTQTISEAPFPNDLYRGPEGVSLAPLGADPVYASLARETALAQLDAAIAGRPGFGFSQPIQLFANEEIALDSLEGRVHLVAVDGPEAGREVAVESWWSPHSKALSFFPAPGDWMMPDSTYVLALEPGVTTLSGEAIGAPPALGELLTAERSATSGDAWDRNGALRNYVNERGVPVVATVFRTEPSLDPLQAMFAATKAAKLPAPTRELRYDKATSTMVEGATFEGAALDELYGTPSAPFATNPGSWESGSRASAAAIGGAPYEGGSLRGKVAKVAFGSITVPAFDVVAKNGKAVAAPLVLENGVAKSSLTAMVPISVFLCEEHLAKPGKVPVAVFTHGGTASRNNATPLAAMNCQRGIATVAADLPFHGGRSEFTLVDGRVVPTRADELNELSGLAKGEPGFTPDGVGDPAGADGTVGRLFGLDSALEPGVVEAHLLTVPTELAALVRLLGEGDWSAFHAGLSFDTSKLFLENLSFGTTFTTGFLALSDDWIGAIGSVPSGHILSANLTVAPSNASLATPVVGVVLGLASTAEELGLGAYRDPVVGLYSWLTERGDSMAFAPYVLRHRSTKTARNMVQTGDSWDETLASPSQLRLNAALGLPVLEADGWVLDPTVPGAATVMGKKAEATTSANVSFDGVTHTAGIFFGAESCHAQLITPLCKKRFAKQYPPVKELPANEVKVTLSPICAIHAQGLAFLDSLLGGAGSATIVPPSGSCDDVYGK